jgi:RimJ/RimL family protein N-acetyltransferase
MKLIPYIPSLHGQLAQTWQEQLGQTVFIEPPDESKSSLTYIVTLGGEPVGWVQGFNIDPINRKCQVGIGFTRGKASVREAAEEMARILFSLGLNRLCARVLATNKAPVRLLEWLGFRLEGIERGAVIRNGEAVDVKVYGLLRSEWRG